MDFYISTTESSTNKDVCYYSSYNLPAFLYVLGPDSWERLRPLYLKLSKFNEAKIQKTLGHSIHEFAKILGPEITQADLVPIMIKFLNEENEFKESKLGAMKNFHVFLKELKPEDRNNYLPFIVPPKENTDLEWRSKYILANNLGHYSMLFSQEVVIDTFIPMFFRFCFDPVAKVAETSASSLALILKSIQDEAKME